MNGNEGIHDEKDAQKQIQDHEGQGSQGRNGASKEMEGR